jgi:hypothetical protein
MAARTTIALRPFVLVMPGQTQRCRLAGISSVFLLLSLVIVVAVLVLTAEERETVVPHAVYLLPPSSGLVSTGVGGVRARGDLADSRFRRSAAPTPVPGQLGSAAAVP